MLIGHYLDRLAEPQTKGDNVGTVMRRLITRAEGAGVFSMRVITIDQGGHIGLHSHPWEHEIFVIRGCGKVVTRDEEREMEFGNYVWIPPNEEHGFVNTGAEPLEFICCIPVPEGR